MKLSNMEIVKGLVSRIERIDTTIALLEGKTVDSVNITIHGGTATVYAIGDDEKLIQVFIDYLKDYRAEIIAKLEELGVEL